MLNVESHPPKKVALLTSRNVCQFKSFEKFIFSKLLFGKFLTLKHKVRLPNRSASKQNYQYS